MIVILGTASDIATRPVSSNDLFGSGTNIAKASSVESLSRSGSNDLSMEHGYAVPTESHLGPPCSVVHLGRFKTPQSGDSERFRCEICKSSDALVPDFLFATSLF